MSRFATIVLAGKPNAGKSTLLNALVGQKLAITSARPQSTRYPVTGIVTEGDTQPEFVDPPGLLDPRYLLQEAMLALAVAAIETADGIVYLQPVDEGKPESLEAVLPEGVKVDVPVLSVVTKIDLSDDRRQTTDNRQQTEDPIPDSRFPTSFHGVSAVTGEGLDQLLDWCRQQARPGPFRHEVDSVSGQPVRFFVSEFIREAAFELLDQELPYAVSVEIDEFREGSEPVYIRATLFVERESQKGIVIGRGGDTIKAIGTKARKAAQDMLGEKVFLDLRVKVLPKWRRSPHHLRRFGLPVPDGRKA